MRALHSEMNYKERLTIKRLPFKNELGVAKERYAPVVKLDAVLMSN